MHLYRALLRAYPASFRGEYGAEMAAIFIRRWRDAGAAARLGLLLAAIPDVVIGAAAVHLDLLRYDLRDASRSLRRAPGFAFTAIAIVALGIGANTAAFSIAHFVLLRPLPFPQPDRLVTVWQTANGYGGMELTPGNYRDWKAAAKAVEHFGAYTTISATLAGSGEPQRIDGAWVTGDVFPALGVGPALGRTLESRPDVRIGEMRPGGLPVVISDGLWRAAFAADRHVIGRPITLDNQQHVIIGVMPPSFRFPDKRTAFWMPLVLPQNEADDHSDNFLDGIGRLRPGATVATARAEMAALAAESRRRFPKDDRDVGAMVYALHEELARPARPLVLALSAAAVCVLLIVCANLANLLLGRALSRRQEIAVRAALGAGRERMVRQLATESLTLAAIGGVLGIALAAAGVPLLWRLVPVTFPTEAAPGIDLRVMAFAAVLTVVTSVVFSLAPLVRLGADTDARGLRESGRISGGRQRLRSVLVAAEVLATVVLLVTSGLAIRALSTIGSRAPGFRVDDVLTLRTELPMPKYETTAARTAYYSRVLDRVRVVPGVQSAAFTSFLPMVFGGGIWPVGLPGEPATERIAGHVASLRFVTPDFFRTLDIPVRAGRGPADTDTMTAQMVAVVSESFARRYWPGQSAIGHRFSFAFIDRTIVGVVGDVRVRGLEKESEPQVYIPSRQAADRFLVAYAPKDLIVRTTAPAAAVVPAIRSAIRDADPQQPITDVRSMRDVVDAQLATRGVEVRALAAFAGVALLLAAIGLHGVLAFAVSQRTVEIGVRMALGADRIAILTMIFRQSATMVAAGLVPGMVLAYAAGRSLGSIIAGVSPGDGLTYALVVAVTVLMTVAGTLAPTLRAMRIDPLRAIRHA